MTQTPEPQPIPEPAEPLLDFDSDAPLTCNRDQSGDETCESCQ